MFICHKATTTNIFRQNPFWEKGHTKSLPDIKLLKQIFFRQNPFWEKDHTTNRLLLQILDKILSIKKKTYQKNCRIKCSNDKSPYNNNKRTKSLPDKRPNNENSFQKKKKNNLRNFKIIFLFFICNFSLFFFICCFSIFKCSLDKNVTNPIFVMF